MRLFNQIFLLLLSVGCEATTQRHDAESPIQPQECVRQIELAEGCPRSSSRPCHEYLKQMLIILRSATPFVHTLLSSFTAQEAMSTTIGFLPTIQGSSMTTLPVATSSLNQPRMFRKSSKSRHHITANLLLPLVGIWRGRRRPTLAMASSLT